MALGEITESVIGAIPFGDGLNLTGLPPEIISKVVGLITILKAAGIIFIIYIIFLILRWIFTLKRYRITKRMDKKINEMDRKLDLLLNDRKIGKESPLIEVKKETKEIHKKIQKEKRKKKKNKK